MTAKVVLEMDLTADFLTRDKETAVIGVRNRLAAVFRVLVEKWPPYRLLRGNSATFRTKKR